MNNFVSLQWVSVISERMCIPVLSACCKTLLDARDAWIRGSSFMHHVRSVGILKPVQYGFRYQDSRTHWMCWTQLCQRSNCMSLFLYKYCWDYMVWHTELPISNVTPILGIRWKLHRIALPSCSCLTPNLVRYWRVYQDNLRLDRIQL
jgi:hypothetical protein